MGNQVARLSLVGRTGSLAFIVNVYLFPHVGAVFLRNKGSEEEGTKVFPEVFFQYCVDVPVSP